MTAPLPVLGARVELVELDPAHGPHTVPFRGQVVGHAVQHMSRYPRPPRGYWPAAPMACPEVLVLVWLDRDVEPADHTAPAAVFPIVAVHPDNLSTINNDEEHR